MSFWKRRLGMNQKRWGLVFEFARAADAAVASALRNPFGHLLIEEDFRRVLFRKFPYTLIYLPRTETLAIWPPCANLSHYETVTGKNNAQQSAPADAALEFGRWAYKTASYEN